MNYKGYILSLFIFILKNTQYILTRNTMRRIIYSESERGLCQLI